ncbi:hypothetical protein CRE_25936 [Caenorhabditis remanei]|uniref:F-box domain-containing protein n=1 Tax=Caenorhabditis remanei TaxID=31234 RepID=E3NK10_CAERE|nr:hypothetical protein CRE_25936 [Caenorhabditis remanei]
MTDFIINNPITLRGCILYEFTKGKGPFRTYQKLMKKLGDDCMTYPEFEFWYMRFARGNFDLDYDISLEPKKRQITDLPVDLFEKIGDSLHFVDRNQLRLVSKDIQFRVDNWDPQVTRFSCCNYHYWEIVQNSKTHEFHRLLLQRVYPTPDIFRMLKNPKLRLKNLTIYKDTMVKWEIIEKELRKSSIKLHVNNLDAKDPDYPIDISLFAPESLEEVSLSINNKSIEKVKETLHSEQCKHLKMLTIRTKLSPAMFPLESLIGYPRFTIEFKGGSADMTLAQFIKVIKLVKCTQLESAKLVCRRSSREPIKRHLNDKETMVPDRPNIRRYPIQGSTDFYEINVGKTVISIERKSQEIFIICC